MNNTDIIGEEATVRQIVENDYSATNRVFEDDTVKTIRQHAFERGTLRRLILPSIEVFSYTHTFKQCWYLEDIDFGGGDMFNARCFHESYLLRDLILRKTEGVVQRADDSFNTNGVLKYQPLICNVYVPRSLIASYQTASNWSTLYASNPNLFKAIEDYTVDGTLTGEMNWELIDALPTPVFEMGERTFNGSSDYVDTGVKLFETTTPEFTILCDFEWPAQSGSNAGIFGCSTSSVVGIRAYRNSTSTSIAFYHTRPGTSSTHNNTPTFAAGDRVQVAWYVKDGLSTLIVYKDGKDYQIYYNSGTTPSATLDKTLVIGKNDWGGNTFYKGTMHMFKVFNKALNGRQIRTVLGLD